jgi:phosphate-selective porin OprO/OprP
MRGTFGRALLAFAAAVACLALAAPASAAEGAEGGVDGKAIREEIKAYMKAEKAKKDEEDREKGVMKVSWKDTVSFESADKRFKAKLIGRVQADYWTFEADEDFETAIGDEFDTAAYFRRARLGIDVTFLQNTRAKLEYDFARGGANQNGFADVFVALVDLDDCGAPLPDVYVGHMKEPWSLDELTSTNVQPFMEKALPTLTFSPVRNTGVMLEKGLIPYGTGGEKPECFERLLLQLGVFGAFSNNFGDGVFSDDGPSEFDGDQDGWAVTGRAVFVPWYDCSCPACRVAHVGVAGSYRTDLRPDNIRFRSRPEVGVGPRTIDTGNDVVADEVVMVCAEAAIVYDRLSAQGEYVLVDVSAPTQDDPTYTGWFVQATYSLTGECRAYRKGKGTFDRMKPCRPFFCDECRAMGPGAWEVAARFSTVDLNDGVLAVQGGEQWDLTLGVNWYLNPNVRVQLNYVHAEVEDLPVGAARTDGSVDAFGVRVAASW